jgi:hypothetical protein
MPHQSAEVTISPEHLAVPIRGEYGCATLVANGIALNQSQFLGGLLCRRDL